MPRFDVSTDINVTVTTFVCASNEDEAVSIVQEKLRNASQKELHEATEGSVFHVTDIYEVSEIDDQ